MGEFVLLYIFSCKLKNIHGTTTQKIQHLKPRRRKAQNMVATGGSGQ